MLKIHALWRGGIAALALALIGAPANAAQVQLPYVLSPSLQPVTATAVLCVDTTGAYIGCSGGGGGSGGTSTTAAPTYLNNATNQPLSLDLSGNLRTILGGTLPAFAATPTFNLGTLNGAALDTTVSTMSGKLPSSLGAKTGANSLSVAPNSDTPFPITANQTGFNVSATPTIQNAAYASGNCMGGFQTVALGTTGSNLSQVGLSSKGGLATSKQVYLFSANPSSSTCTDKSTFTLNAADVGKLMRSFSLVPVAPAGTTVTTAAQPNLGLGVPSGGTIYVAIVETATETPATTTDLVLSFSGQ